MATISAQPMFRPPLCQFMDNFQKSQSLSKTIPIPHDDEASTQNLILDVGGGLDKMEPQKSANNWVRHHSMSDNTLGLGDLRA
jgi:hypothetical protein